MADFKVWKLSKFEGGLNNHTDPKDLKSNEFAKFQDVYAGTVGIIRPLGKAVKSLEIPNQEVTGTIIPGQGLAKWNSDYTFVSSSQSDLIAQYTQLADTVESGEPARATFKYSSVLWLFEDTFPLGGTLTFTPTVNGVAIGAAITVISGNDWFDHSGSGHDDATLLPPWDTTMYGYDTTDSNIFNQFPYYGDTVDFGQVGIGDKDSNSWNTTTTNPWRIDSGNPPDFWYDFGMQEWIATIYEAGSNNWYEEITQIEISPWNIVLASQYATAITGYKVFNEARFLLGGVTGAPTSDDNIAIMGLHEFEWGLGPGEQGSGDIAAGALHARWAYGFMDLSLYTDRLLHNASHSNVWACDDERICQGELIKSLDYTLNIEYNIQNIESVRTGGFGSTGTK